MADYVSRIASLTAEQALLAQRQSALAAQRREEIGKLVDRRGVLATDDDVLDGLFLGLKKLQLQTTARVLTSGATRACGFGPPSLNDDAARMPRSTRTALVQVKMRVV
jgi:hypothetical protein